MVKSVVILGAGWAGLPLAHKLLKYTVPKCKGNLKVYLVSPNTHFYWNVAAVRGVVPGAIADEELFLPIQPGFAQYSKAYFEFVLGKAVQVTADNDAVEIARNDGSQQTLYYDQLVIATGSTMRSGLPFKPIGTHQQTLAALHELQNKIQNAQSIVIAGAGPTGVETAGELAAAYGDSKKITLVMSGESALQASTVLPSVSRIIEDDLGKLKVNLLRGVQVKDVSSAIEREGAALQNTQNATILTLSDGTKLTTDLYLPLFGIQVNTGFVPTQLLDSAENLALDSHMRVKGTRNIWGIGDAGDLEVKQVTVIDAQIIYLSTALDLILTTPTAETQQAVKQYQPSPKTMIFISMGKKYATGQIGGWRLWGWLVAYVKGRKLFVDTAEGYVGGKHLRHASM